MIKPKSFYRITIWYKDDTSERYDVDNYTFTENWFSIKFDKKESSWINKDMISSVDIIKIEEEQS